MRVQFTFDKLSSFLLCPPGTSDLIVKRGNFHLKCSLVKRAFGSFSLKENWIATANATFSLHKRKENLCYEIIWMTLNVRLLKAPCANSFSPRCMWMKKMHYLLLTFHAGWKGHWSFWSLHKSLQVESCQNWFWQWRKNSLVVISKFQSFYVRKSEESFVVWNLFPFSQGLEVKLPSRSAGLQQNQEPTGLVNALENVSFCFSNLDFFLTVVKKLPEQMCLGLFSACTEEQQLSFDFSFAVLELDIPIVPASAPHSDAGVVCDVVQHCFWVSRIFSLKAWMNLSMQPNAFEQPWNSQGYFFHFSWQILRADNMVPRVCQETRRRSFPEPKSGGRQYGLQKHPVLVSMQVYDSHLNWAFGGQWSQVYKVSTILFGTVGEFIS